MDLNQTPASFCGLSLFTLAIGVFKFILCSVLCRSYRALTHRDSQMPLASVKYRSWWYLLTMQIIKLNKDVDVNLGLSDLNCN